MNIAQPERSSRAQMHKPTERLPQNNLHAIPGGCLALNRQFIEQLSIRPINFSDPTDVARHDRMVALVEQMLELHKRLATAASEHDRALVQRQIEATDREIDRLVYNLYRPTEDEIKIIIGEPARCQRQSQALSNSPTP